MPSLPSHPRAGSIDTVVFDFGNVLIRWDPRNLYRQIFPDDAQMERFLREICTMEWNERQDEGRSWAEAVTELQVRHPDHAAEIAAYDLRWEEMLGGAIEGTVEILRELSAGGVRLLGLTNWSAEKFPIGRRQMPWFDLLDGVIVSGDVGLKKPDPRIFQLLIDEFGLEPERSLFIDDAPRNIKTADRLGFATHCFANPDSLRSELRGLKLPVGAGAREG